MSASELTHHFTAAILESAARRGVGGGLPTAPQGRRWSGEDFVRVMQDVGTLLDDGFFGMAKNRLPVDAPRFGLELMLLSANLGDALDRYARFYALASDGLRLALETAGDQAVLTVEVPEPSRDPRHFLAEWYATRIISLANWITGSEIPQLEVTFAHEQQLPKAAYASALGDKVRFDAPRNAILFPARHLGRPVIRGMKGVEVAAKSTDFDPERQRFVHRSWSSVLKASLRAALQDQVTLPTMEDLAMQHNVSSQTLRRGLKAEGVSYREVKAEARRELVLDKIGDSTLTLGEISILAGFAEPNGLVRAMRSWSGLSPSALRRVVQEGEQVPGAG